MPALADLTGMPPAGYERVVAFVRDPGDYPSNWFIQEHDEFSPALLIIGGYYDVEAATEWDARAQAARRFARDLSRHGLPLPPDPIHAELTDWF
jgi:hypothetical protein